MPVLEASATQVRADLPTTGQAVRLTEVRVALATLALEAPLIMGQEVPVIGGREGRPRVCPAHPPTTGRAVRLTEARAGHAPLAPGDRATQDPAGTGGDAPQFAAADPMAPCRTSIPRPQQKLRP